MSAKQSNLYPSVTSSPNSLIDSLSSGFVSSNESCSYRSVNESKFKNYEYIDISTELNVCFNHLSAL
jgi:hypothetical protein